MSEKKMSEQVQEAFDNMEKHMLQVIQERKKEIIEAIRAEAKRKKDLPVNK